MAEPISSPDTAIPEGPQMGMMARFVATYFSPRRAFSTVRRNHEWLLVVLLLTIVGLGSFQLTKDIIQDEAAANLDERLAEANLPEAQKQEIKENAMAQIGNPLWQLLTPIYFVVKIVVVAAILLFLGNIIMGGQANFLHLLNMYALTSLIEIPDTIIKVPLIISKGSMKVQTSLALLLSPESDKSFLFNVLARFDLFGLWQLALVMIGMSVLCRTSTAKSFWTVGLAWLIWAVAWGGLQTVLAKLGMGFGM